MKTEEVKTFVLPRIKE